MRLLRLLSSLRYVFAVLAVAGFAFLGFQSFTFSGGDIAAPDIGVGSAIPDATEQSPEPEPELAAPSTYVVEVVLPVVSSLLSVLGFLSQMYFTNRSDLREQQKFNLELQKAAAAQSSRGKPKKKIKARHMKTAPRDGRLIEIYAGKRWWPVRYQDCRWMRDDPDFGNEPDFWEIDGLRGPIRIELHQAKAWRQARAG